MPGQHKITIIVLLVVIVALGIGVSVLVSRAKPAAEPAPVNTISYLPLGDSYTIGESVDEQQRWPNQLIAKFTSADGRKLYIIANPAKTGYTTQDLIDKELPLIRQYQPTLVTIQIGVNDYVQGVSQEKFAQNLRYIVNQAKYSLAQPKNIVLVTIPDYAKTPAGAQYGNVAQATAAITASNALIKQIGKEANVPVADIFSISQRVTMNKNLVAKDGLHPSGLQYEAWLAQIEPAVATLEL